jgi:methylated-DNA-[protein]-cysteine S-methyltransferase
MPHHDNAGHGGRNTPPGDGPARQGRDGDAATPRAVGRGLLAGPAALGAVEVAWSAVGLVSLRFVGTASTGAAPLDAARRDGDVVPPEYARPLARYFAGEAIDPARDVPVDLGGTPFQRRVWTALRRIPRGQVRTYASIAAEIGAPRALRAVGAANARNPLAVVVPCHRVVAHGMALGGYSAGLDRKRALLALEGVEVRGDHVVAGQLGLLG